MPAQRRALHDVDEVVARHLRRLGEHAVAAAPQVMVEVLRVDDAAVVHQPAHLHLRPVEVPQHRHAIRRAVDDADRKVLRDARHRRRSERLDLVRRDVAVQHVLPVRLPHLHDRLRPGDPVVARLHHVEPAARRQLAQLRQRRPSPGRDRRRVDGHDEQRPRRLLNRRPRRLALRLEFVVRRHAIHF